VPTNKQRREAERRRLQRQLEERRQREAARKRFTMVASIVGTLVLIVAVVVVIVATSGGSDKPNNTGGGAPSSSAAASSPSDGSSTAGSSAAPLGTPVACTKPGKDATASFHGVTVGKATDLAHQPTVSSRSSTDPSALECQDLVVGKGTVATPASQVSVQYTGVLYQNGTQFDSSWTNGGKPVSFSLTQVVPGFTQGIGGVGKVAPMRVGGRRIMILPPALGYGAQGQGSIPANSTLVFVVDLTSVTG
jgi:hypothetical protein